MAPEQPIERPKGETYPGAEYSKQKSRRGYHSVKAIDPHDGKEWELLLSEDMLKYTASKGHGAALELAHTVRWALLNPRQIYRGVRDDENDVDDDGWLCYVATPPHAYDFKRGVQVPAWPNEVFAVYVTDERVIYRWMWLKCDENDLHKPVDHESRFRAQVF